jgi:hypothetical protein
MIGSIQDVTKQKKEQRLRLFETVPNKQMKPYSLLTGRK